MYVCIWNKTSEMYFLYLFAFLISSVDFDFEFFF